MIPIVVYSLRLRFAKRQNSVICRDPAIFLSKQVKSRISQITPVQIIKYALMFHTGILCQSERNNASQNRLTSCYFQHHWSFDMFSRPCKIRFPISRLNCSCVFAFNAESLLTSLQTTNYSFHSTQNSSP